MVQISVCNSSKTLKRKGFTLVEIAIVITLILVLAIPIGVLLMNYTQGNIFSSSYIKEQYYANVIMQDIEQRIRRGDMGSITFSNYTLSFTYTDANTDGSKKETLYCVYALENANTTSAIFKRGISTSSNPTTTIFPTGLEAGIIQDFNVSIGTSAPYYVEIKILTKSNFTLANKVYLLNYGR
ncbi:type IV pilus modification PilV family protein [Caldisericum exile]|uniref:Prepilin-type N-terminal cleavage/methylation domain-containing protein n=1 Tax=Caldisericum exile (strain DSM 21853 / NBRC 104410 / AZM16c01) TaxID=511051 RepID=A0A7U6JH54_CALEA|nr:prepilin-type N-terminal cleavage/methylation domain-containing protein [Caldisericum exile]BAL81442.1 hypothetical protein CSE_13160 [Caldisericum exile AZM16c01]